VLRYVNWAILKDKNTGFSFLYANTHFDNARANKDPSATLFHNRISVLAKNLPVIATGDFNTRADTDRYQRLIGMSDGTDKQALLHNAYDLAGSPVVASDLLPNQRIDHILAGGTCKIKAQHWHIDTRPMANGQPLSDHDAIVSELIFSPN
jgi:endonuclease/exonuclease/phosphatase family metal-dependent hydrolase